MTTELRSFVFRRKKYFYILLKTSAVDVVFAFHLSPRIVEVVVRRSRTRRRWTRRGRNCLTRGRRRCVTAIVLVVVHPIRRTVVLEDTFITKLNLKLSSIVDRQLSCSSSELSASSSVLFEKMV